MNNNHAVPGAHKISAFTWLELLVVIVILFLLIGILLPAMQIGTQASKPTVDRSNLRQIGIAMHQYAVDHEDALPIHPRDITYVFPDSVEDVFLNPYQEQDSIVDRGDFGGPAIRFGGYVFINLGLNIDEIDNPTDLILTYTAKVTPKQTKRGVLFADGHAELWEEEQLRAALPEDVDVDALDGP